MTDLRAQLQQALGTAYTIEREMAGGGMSRVFKAREAGLNRDVVIKVLSADVAAGVSLDRFTREIQLAASLQQANIVPLLSAGDADGVPYFTMPYVQGESLRFRLAQGIQLPIAECVGMLRDVARALSYAHARGVVHRDIKPDNVLISHGAAVVTDFGIAKAVSASRTLAEHGTLTQVGTSLGTPAYMSPEAIAGDPRIDHRADLYAWGCLAYELLTGAPPFVKDSPQRVLAAHLSEAPRAIAPQRPDAPPALERLVMHALAKEPNERVASADDILRELDSVSTPRAVTLAGPGSAGVEASRATSGRPRMIALAVLGAVAAIAVVVVAVQDRTPRAPPATAAPDRSIAVLPLANLSGDKSDDYFGIGLAEEMTRALAKTGMRVIGRVSAGALLAKGLDERAVAKELGVGSLLTGTVQRDGGQVRINVSLLSAADGAVRWTEKYDRPLTNVFVLQDEIARSVATTLLGSLGVKPASPTRNETADPEAYALFLQGQVLFNRRTAQTLQQAIELFEQAITRDPKYARAHASLAMSQTVLPNYVQGNSSTMLARATETAQRAIALDSTIAESYTALAHARAALGENREADGHFRHAIALDSTVATAWGWYGLLANHLGDFASAHRRIARARELEPASLIARTWEAQVLIVERRFAAADSVAGATVALDSTFALAREARAEALLGLKRYAEAVSIFERRLAELPANRATETHGLLAYAYARAGRLRDARELIAKLPKLHDGRLPATGILAAALEELGDHEAAVALLGDAVAQHDVWLLQFNRSERYDRLRRDPRAAAMLANLEAR